MDTFGANKRILREVLFLINDPYVQSFFKYESCEKLINSEEYHISGYLLPRYAPYKYGAYKIRIRIPVDYPFQAPTIELLTFLYHPAVSNSLSKPSFCKECCCNGWSSVMALHHVIEDLVLKIDQPELIEDYCVMNKEAKLRFDQNRHSFEEYALKWVKKYACQLPNTPVMSSNLTVNRELDNNLNEFDRFPLEECLENDLTSLFNVNRIVSKRKKYQKCN